MWLTGKIASSFRNTIVNWPPLVLFIICLMFFSVFSFGLGAFVFRNDLVNPNVLSWNQFLHGLERQSFCSGASSDAPWSLPATANRTTDHQLHLAVVLAWNVHTDIYTPVSANSSLYMMGSAGVTYNVTLSALPNATADTAVAAVCVRVRGPVGALPSAAPSVQTPPDCNLAAATSASPGGGRMQPIPDSDGSCSGGAAYKLEYESMPSWEALLSPDDKLLVYRHMTCMSAFLLVMAAAMLLCTMLRNRTRYTHSVGDKVTLEDE